MSVPDEVRNRLVDVVDGHFVFSEHDRIPTRAMLAEAVDTVLSHLEPTARRDCTLRHLHTDNCPRLYRFKP